MYRSTKIFAALAVAGAFALAGCSSSSVTTPSGGASSAPTKAAAPAAKVGTRENPAPLKSTVSGPDWDATINSVNLNGNEAVAKANQLNDKPKAGNVYIVVNWTVKYKGDDANGATPAEVSLEYVTADGKTINSYDSLVVAPDPAMDISEIYKGASKTGNEVFEVPAATASKGVLAVEPGMGEDKTFVAVK